MTTEEYMSNYWNQYILIEKEFRETIQYVALCEENKNVFSDAYLKILLQIGSEIDIVFKQYCTSLDSSFNGDKIGHYKNCIQNNKEEFIFQAIKIYVNGDIVKPWTGWQIMQAPFWWTAYNKIKHNRYSICEIDAIQKQGYKFANQEYTLEALAGLFQILIYYYYDLVLVEGKKVMTPVPGSRLFRLTGENWDIVDFYTDYAFYINDEGYLICEFGSLPY